MRAGSGGIISKPQRPVRYGVVQARIAVRRVCIPTAGINDWLQGDAAQLSKVGNGIAPFVDPRGHVSCGEAREAIVSVGCLRIFPVEHRNQIRSVGLYVIARDAPKKSCLAVRAERAGDIGVDAGPRVMIGTDINPRRSRVGFLRHKGVADIGQISLTQSIG